MEASFYRDNVRKEGKIKEREEGTVEGIVVGKKGKEGEIERREDRWKEKGKWKDVKTERRIKRRRSRKREGKTKGS